MPSTYAAMSHAEFFAEMYALYYDPNDPKRGGIAGDGEIASWFDRHTGRPDPRKPRRPGRRTPSPRTVVRRRRGRRR